LRNPKLLLGVMAVVLGVMGVVGKDVESMLKPTALTIPGTPAENANEILKEHFGDSSPVAIMLRGPADELDRQGPELVAGLRADGPKVTTLSPWDRGSVGDLRPDPETALIFADYHEPVDVAVDEQVTTVRATVAEHVSEPVTASASGFPLVAKALQDESVAATVRGELIAIPILLIVLLFVFRSPIAAAIPLAFGGITVIASRGVIAGFASFADVDAFAVGVASMMGLALGVDYALLMVSRFREELERLGDPLEAALLTGRVAGRTVLFAGSTLFGAMLVSMFLLPGNLFVSMAGSVVIVTVLSVCTAYLAGPALLLLLGENINRWPLGGTTERKTRWLKPVNRVLRRPVIATVLIGGAMLALAAPAIAIRTGPPDVDQLPHDDQTREDTHLIADTIGPGWTAPYIVIAAADEGSITDPARLEAIAKAQKEIAADPAVASVIGPAQIVRQSRSIGTLRRSTSAGPEGDLARLQGALAEAGDGVSQLRDGIATARDGAGQLSGGSDEAARGAYALSNGLAQARKGSDTASEALEKFRTGARKLAEGSGEARSGAGDLSEGIGSAREELRGKAVPGSGELAAGLREGAAQLGRLEEPAQIAHAELLAAWQQLQAMTIGKTDPAYGALALHLGTAMAAISGRNPVTGDLIDPEYAGLPAALAQARSRLSQAADGAEALSAGLASLESGLGKIDAGARELADGNRELEKGNRKLAGAAERFDREGGKLEGGLARLDTGASQLAAGVSDLSAGADDLAGGLGSGYERSAPLESGVGRIQNRIASSRENARELQRRSPGLFDSGYFLLAALDGAPEDQRDRISQAIDLHRGGSAAQMLVIPKDVDLTRNVDLDDRLDAAAAKLGEVSGTTAGITGAGAGLKDFQKAASSRIPLVVISVTLLTYLILVVVLRALLLPAIAVFLNLVTVAAAFGVITLLFHVPDGIPFGGNDFISTIGAAGIFGVVFGLSIDYAVFLLMRMREHIEDGGSHEEAISFGLEKTAGVITGAAAIMAGVFTSFALAPIATVSQFGVGLTVAVILDATIIRLILLPALMRIFGPRVWWLPPSLERVVPRFQV
jgi:RND superfamily putative drug exporter